MTIGEAMDKYLTLKSSVLSPHTVNEKMKTRKYIPDDIANMYLSKFEADILQRWVSDLAVRLEPKTVKNYYGNVSTAIHHYAPNLSFKITLPQQKKKDIYVPSDDEIRHALTILRDRGREDMYTAVLMGSNCGLRRGEICALRNDKKNSKAESLTFINLSPREKTMSIF